MSMFMTLRIAFKALGRNKLRTALTMLGMIIGVGAVIAMVAIGEETGALDTMLSKVADFYEREVDEAVASLTAAIEPLMIIFLGVIVGMIVAGMFLPLFKIIGTLSVQ